MIEKIYKNKYMATCDKSRARINRAKVREGKEVYRHPRGYFVVLEFEGESGKFREAFWPECQQELLEVPKKKTSQEGLRDGYTRATFIVREDLLKKLKDYAYTERETLKDVINYMIEQFLDGKDFCPECREVKEP